MGAPDLLQHLRSAGLVLSLTSDDRLRVTPRSALTDDHRRAIRAYQPALVLTLKAEGKPSPPRRSGNPLMTPEQGDACHAGGWDPAEVDAFEARRACFARTRPASEAEHLAERLVLRDRDGDDLRLCLECAALTERGRCMVAARGRLSGADRRHEPVPVLLHRCPGFMLVPGLA